MGRDRKEDFLEELYYRISRMNYPGKDGVEFWDPVTDTIIFLEH